MFQLLYSDAEGRMYEYPELSAGGRTGNLLTEIEETDVIPLPQGASLVMIPDGIPVGVNALGRYTVVETDRRGCHIYAVGALLPQGYTRTLLPAYKRSTEKPLPLFGYAAVGFRDGQVYVAARQTDETEKWDPVNYSTPELASLVKDFSREFKNNRIINQLSRCALTYNCFTAQNIFYRRWEGGIPVSPACNARCLGCISLQPAECCPAPQSRINFTPTVDEITEVALPHLSLARDGIISFGQGCEGEPSLAADTISGAIEAIRKETSAGTINMNTNGGYTEGIQKICLAGIDSLRVSVISARASIYTAYYNPKNYTWDNVCESIAFAKKNGVFVSLNLLTMPGLTDLPVETEAMVEFIQRYDINMVQLRNLNIDPDFLAEWVPLADREVLGIDGFIEVLREEIPKLIIGNFSRPVKIK